MSFQTVESQLMGIRIEYYGSVIEDVHCRCERNVSKKFQATMTLQSLNLLEILRITLLNILTILYARPVLLLRIFKVKL